MTQLMEKNVKYLTFNDMTLNKFILLHFYKQQIYLESYIIKNLKFLIKFLRKF